MIDYEILLLFDAELPDERQNEIVTRTRELVERGGGSFEGHDVWGRRKLAYEINKKTEGIYAVVDFTAESKTTDELDRQLNLSEAVMRTKVLRAEEAIAQVAAHAKAQEERAAKKAAASFPSGSTR